MKEDWTQLNDWKKKDKKEGTNENGRRKKGKKSDIEKTKNKLDHYEPIQNKKKKPRRKTNPNKKKSNREKTKKKRWLIRKIA